MSSICERGVGGVRVAAEGASSAGLADFELLSVLGRGGFGKVYQVRHRASGDLYAMKVLNKADLRRRNQIERTR
jgi:RAC serine/threonine-protein kinase